VYFGVGIFAGEVVLNLLSVRKHNGNKLKALKDIAWNYATGELWVDASLLLVLSLQLLASIEQFNQLFVGLSVLKVSSLLGKLHRIERWLFKTEYYERYWSLFKIMLFNLAFAHAIAIALNLMARANP
jgi:predicted ferric reductase